MKCRSCIRIRFREGHQRCGLCLCFTKAGGSWSKVRRLPRTLPPPYALQARQGRAALYCCSSKSVAFGYFCQEREGTIAQQRETSGANQDGQGRRSVIINTRRAPSLRHTIHRPTRSSHKHHGAYHRSSAQTASTVQCHKLFPLVNLSRTRCRR
jgi:hypothetical protein